MSGRSILLWLLVPGLLAAEPASNWSADYPQCNHRSDLLKRSPLNLGVRFNTANPLLAQQFRRAMDFWATVLDLEWHEDSTETCSMELSDGARDLFEPNPYNMVARSQFPDRRDFQGWIAFNPAVKLSPAESYRISVHEIGHMMGLKHNSNTRSLMYDFDLECSEELDSTDLRALRARHKLRISATTETIKFTAPRLIAPTVTASRPVAQPLAVDTPPPVAQSLSVAAPRPIVQIRPLAVAAQAR